MTKVTSTILLLLDGPADRKQYARWLQADADWQGTLIELSRDEFLESQTAVSEVAQQDWSADIIILDEITYRSSWSQIQSFGQSTNTAFLVILETSDEAFTSSILASGIDDFLIAAHLSSIRLCQTVKTLWRQVHLHRTLQTGDRSIRELAIVEAGSDHKQPEAELDPHTNLRQVLLDNLPHIAWFKDCESRFLAVNAAFGESCGFTPNELVGKTDLDIWPADLANAYREDDFAVIASGQPKRVEEPLVMADGSKRWIETIKTPIFDDMGEILGTVGIATDVTERRRLEQDLRESQAKLADALNNSKACITRFRLYPDFSWDYDYYSPGCEVIYGYSSEALKNDVQLWRSRVFPEDFEHAVKPLFESIYAGQTTGDIEFRFRHQDGSIRWISERCTARWDETQTCWIVTVVGVDISDRKRNEIDRQHYEDALAQSEAKFRSLVENISEIIYTCTPDGILSYISPQVKAILGYHPQALIGQSLWHSLVHPDDVAIAQDAMQRLITTGQPQRGTQMRLRHQDGHWHWLRSNTSGVFDDEGNLASVQGLVTDIHDQKTAEQALHESQARFEAIYNQAAVGICLASSSSGQILSANQWFCNLLGYTAAELQQMHYADYSHPDDMVIDDTLMQSLMAGDIPHFTIEKRLFHKSGDMRWANVTVSLVRDANGEPLYDVAIVEDISQRKQLEAQRQQTESRIQENRNFLQTILDNLPVSLFVKDARPETFGQFVLINDVFESHLGQARSHIIGKTDYDLFPASEADEFLDKDRDAIATRTKQQLEEIVDRPHLGQRLLQTTKVPIYDASDRPRYLLGISQDVTEHKQAQRQLHDSEARLQEAQRLAHIGNWEYDPITKQTIWSKELLRIYGFDETIQGPTFEEFAARVHPEDWPELSAVIHQALETGTPYTISHRLVRPDGTMRQTYCKGQAILNDQNQVIKLFGVAQDITEITTAHLALQASERKHRALVKALPDLIIQMSGDGVYLDMFAANNMTVLNGDDLIGRNIYEQGLPHDLAEQRMNYIHQALSTGELQVYEQTLFNGQRDVVEEVRILPSGDDEVIIIIRDISDRKAAELALQESERRYATLTESAPVGIFRFDAAGQCVYVNPQWCKMTGRTLETAGGDAWVELLHPDDRERLLTAWAEATAQQAPYRNEGWHVHTNGTVTWFDLQMMPEFDDQGQLIGYVGTVSDITDRKAAEAALQASEERLRTAMEAANMGSWNWNLETNKVVWSESLERLMGLEPGTFDQRIETVNAMIHPDDRQRVAAAIYRALERGDDYNIEFRFIRPDGDIRWAASKGAIILRDTDGRAIAMAGMDIDITERKLAEAQIKEVTQRLQLATDSAKIGIWDYTISEQRLLWDEHMYELYGLPVGTARTPYSTWEHNLHPDDRTQAVAELQAAIRGEKDFHTEFRVLWPDGQVRFIEAHALVWRDAEGNAQRMIGVNWDITDRKRAALQTASQNTLLSQIAQGTALPDILKTLVYEIEQQFDAVMCSVLLLDDDNRLRHGATDKLPSEYISLVEGVQIGDGVGACGTAAFRNQTVITADIAHDPYWRDFKDIALSFGLRACWSTPIVGSNGQVLGTFGTYCPDVRSPRPDELQTLEQMANIAGIAIERTRAAAALQASEVRYRRIVETANEGIWIVDASNITTFVNPKMAAMLGYDVTDIVGAHPFAFMETVDTQEAGQWLQRFRQGNAQQFDFRLRHRDGTNVWVMVSTSPITDETGQYVGTLAMITDISDRKHAEMELQQTTHQLQTFLDNAPTLISRFDPEGRYLQVNPGFTQTLGLTETNIVGQTFADLHPEAVVQRFMTRLAMLREATDSLEVEDEIVIDGATKMFRTILFPAEIEAGTANSFWAIATDITERKQAEQALKQLNEELELRVQERTEALARSEQDLRTIFNNVYDAIFLHDIDGTILDVNDRALEISGATRDQLIGAGIIDLSGPSAPLDITPDCLRRAQAGETLCFEWQNRRFDDNTFFDTEVTLRQVYLNNRPVLLAGVRDIGDRKQAELDLQESRNMLELVLNAIPQRVFWKDQNSRFLGCNPAFANDYQLTQNDIVGKTDAELPWADWAERYNDDDARVIESGISRLNYEEPTTSFHGEHIWIRTSKVPLTNSQGEVIGILGCYDDITDRKRAEQQLEAERLRLQVALEAANMGTWESDLETEFWSERTEAIFGYAPGTFPGTCDALIRLIHPDDRERVYTALTTSFSTQAPFVQEYRIHRLEGELCWVAVNGKVITDENGSGLRIIGVAQDITERKQAEEAVRDSEERLRLALNAAKQGLYDLDLRTGEAIVSATYATMLGYNPVTFRETNAKWLQRLHPDDHERVQAVFLTYVTGKISEYKVEFRQRTKNGQWKWILSVGKIVTRDEMGQPIRMLGTHTDIDDRKRAEEALRESETRFRQIAENIKEVFWLATPEHEILYASPAFEQVWGRSPNTVTAETFLETIHPEDRMRLKSHPDSTNGHYPADLLSGDSKIEYRILRTDGTIRWIRDRAFPVLDDQGQIYRIAGIAEDITERKHLEQEQARLLNILEASPDHVGIATLDGTIIWNNRQAKLIRGLPLDTDVTQISISTYHPQWALDIIQQVGIPAAIQNDIWIGETALLTAANTEIPVSQLILAHRSPTGDIEYLSTIIRDISPLKQAEQTLRQVNAELEARVVERTTELVKAKEIAEAANRAKSTFLANMSHELRTPLNAILGFSQLMGRDQTLSNKHLQELKIINRSGEHLLTLINDILEMSKIEAGQVTLTPTNIVLSQLLDSLSDMLRLKAEAKGLQFTISCHPQLPPFIRTDGHKLRQVLLNLLSNAIKFTQIGSVVLRVKFGNPLLLESNPIDFMDVTEEPIVPLRFEVEDSGSGIAADELDSLFEPFVQTASGRQSQEGTGLGLPISRQFVQLLGGFLDVTSEPEHGSIFFFEIPVQMVEADGIEPVVIPQRPSAIAPNQPIYRILVAEDNWANRILLQNLLTDLGFEVQAVINGQAAIERWQTWRPHLIFMDIRMPKMNGCDATQTIRQLEQSAQGTMTDLHPTKIISLTAGVFEDKQSEFATIGFDDFIRKPIQEAAITDALAKHLGVRYVYTSDVVQQMSSPLVVSQFLTVEMLQALSTDWLQQFYTATIQLNQEAMLAMIADLPMEHHDVAQILNQKVQEFDYETLLNLTQEILEH